MTQQEFIFSNQLKPRLARHFAFWFAFSLHFIIQNLMIGGPGEGKTSRTFLESFIHLLYFLPTYLACTYFFIEVLLPRYLFTRKYTRFIVSFLLLFSISYIAIYYSGAFYLQVSRNIPIDRVTFKDNKYHAIVDGMFVPFMFFSIAAGIKFSKKWYVQQRENEKLIKQKLDTELQLLKTSIHPEFLLHSLHTVERHIDTASAQSPELILQLSYLLSYTLYEKDEDWIPVERELEIISGYINLQEKGFGNHLTFKTEFPTNTEGKFIVPFLLLSIVESSFEYIFETGQEEPALELIASIDESVFHCRLSFSKPFNQPINTILPDERFLSVRKQLESQYSGLHQFLIKSNTENISMDLKIPLYSKDLINVKNQMMNEVPEPA